MMTKGRQFDGNPLDKEVSMAGKHPYISGGAALVQAVVQLRKSFPSQVTADTLKKLSIAPNNESLVIGALRFIGVLDAEGKKTEVAGKVFSKGDPDFQKGLSELIAKAYSDLFEIHGKDAWQLSADQLTSYFRSADQTSEIVGRRQSSTFQTFAGLGGYSEVPAMKQSSSAKKPKPPNGRSKPPKPEAKPEISVMGDSGGVGSKGRDVGLTVRIEVNLPAGADQETYDRIFKSMRENLLNG
jgi:Family of unknown function (DUF5343)